MGLFSKKIHLAECFTQAGKIKQRRHKVIRLETGEKNQRTDKTGISKSVFFRKATRPICLPQTHRPRASEVLTANALSAFSLRRESGASTSVHILRILMKCLRNESRHVQMCLWPDFQIRRWSRSRVCGWKKLDIIDGKSYLQRPVSRCF